MPEKPQLCRTFFAGFMLFIVLKRIQTDWGLIKKWSKNIHDIVLKNFDQKKSKA